MSKHKISDQWISPVNRIAKSKELFFWLTGTISQSHPYTDQLDLGLSPKIQRGTTNMVRWSASITKADWKTHSSYRFSHEPSCMVRFTSPNPAPWISPSGIANGGNWATNGGSTPRDRSPSYGSSLNRRDRDRKVRPLVGTVYPYRLMWSIIFVWLDLCLESSRNVMLH